MKKLFLCIVLVMHTVFMLQAQIYPDTEVKSRDFGYINFKRTHITLPDTILKLPLKDLTTEKRDIQRIFFDAKLKTF